MKVYLVRKHTENINEHSHYNKIMGVYATQDKAQQVFNNIRKMEIDKTNDQKSNRKIVDGNTAFSMRFDFGFCLDSWIEKQEVYE